MFRRLYKWFFQFSKREKLYKCKYVDEVPDKLHLHTVYLVGNEGYYWQAIMLCPCGCKKALHMNLMKEYCPFWKIEIHENKSVSLHPSIDRRVGCKSHFFVHKGRTIWA